MKSKSYKKRKLKMIDEEKIEYLIKLQEANLQISANNNVLLQRILADMDEGNAG